MNGNNKFGSCCSCPMLYDHRIFTSYKPRRDYNTDVMKEINVTDSHTYRSTLQNLNVLPALVTLNESQYKCKGTQFYVVTDINKYFDENLKKELTSQESNVINNSFNN